jgi:transcriptional regulator with XRE-family HTH domain
MSDKNNLRENIRTVLDVEGWPQSLFAQQAEISLPYLNKFLKDKVNPSLDNCSKMAAATGLDLRTLLLPPRDFRELLDSE